MVHGAWISNTPLFAIQESVCEDLRQSSQTEFDDAVIDAVEKSSAPNLLAKDPAVSVAAKPVSKRWGNRTVSIITNPNTLKANKVAAKAFREWLSDVHNMEEDFLQLARDRLIELIAGFITAVSAIYRLWINEAT